MATAFFRQLSAGALFASLVGGHRRCRTFARAIAACIVSVPLMLTGCASIPPEAPELSAQLGGRISALESAHKQLLADYFREKKNRVDEFVEKEWVPTFAKELFNDPRVSNAWDQVVRSGDPAERLKFIVTLAPRLQKKINAKRLELIQPLEDVEQALSARLTSDYDQMRAINSTLTAFLQSASKVEENRKRYLEMIGVSDKTMESAIDTTDQVVGRLVSATQDVSQMVEDTKEYRKKLADLIVRIRTGEK